MRQGRVAAKARGQLWKDVHLLRIPGRAMACSAKTLPQLQLGPT